MTIYDRDDGQFWRRQLEREQKRAEDAWTTQAIQDVVKGLTKRRSAMEDLDYALQGHYAYAYAYAPCVPVPRPGDCSEYCDDEPLHVTYCRTYRWPDMVRDDNYLNENYHQLLRSVANCAYPYNGDTHECCIYPYHYERNNVSGRAGGHHGGCEGDGYVNMGQYTYGAGRGSAYTRPVNGRDRDRVLDHYQTLARTFRLLRPWMGGAGAHHHQSRHYPAS